MKISTRISLAAFFILLNSFSLFAQPTTQATNIVFSSVTSTQMTLTWTNGDGNKRIVVGHQAAAVDANPVDGTNYTASATFGSGTQIGTGNYVVFDGTGNSVTVTGLTANVVYHFRVFEYTSAGSLYLTTTATNNPLSQITLATEPTTQATNVSFTSITNSQMQVSWTNGNGSTRIVLAHQGAAVDANPVDATTYTDNAAFGSGTQIGTGNYVVYKGTGTNVTVTGLSASTTYHFRVYEFNGATGAENYYTATDTNNPNSQSSGAAEPTTQATDILFSGVGTANITASWTDGDGANAIVLVHAGAPVDANPADFTAYTANTAFGSGSEIGTGNFVVFSGAGTTVGISGLSAGTVYHFMVYEYNGTGSLANYFTSTATGNPASRTTLSAVPTNQPTSMVFSTITETSMDVSFTAAVGTPDGYLAVRRTGASPSGTPTDGTTYSVGDPIGDGTVEFIGSAVTFNDAGLTASTTYHYDIYSFNGSGLSINYLTGSGPLEGSQSTLPTEPSTQAIDIVFSSVISTGMNLTWTNGDGAERLVLAKSGSAVDVNPTDGTVYTGNADFGAATDIGSGNKVVFRGSGNSVSISNLSANTVYHFKVYELNNSGGTNYNIANGVSGNPASRTTLATAPANQPTAIVFTNPTTSTLDVSFTAAAGTPDGYLVIRRSGSSPTGTPTDGTTYTAGNTIGDGTVAFVGSGTSFTDTGLSANTVYHYDVFSFNGSGASINYLTTAPLEGSRTTIQTEPTVQAQDIIFSAVSTTGMTLTWTNGDGSERLVLAKSGSAVDTSPVDGTGYNGDANFSTATDIGSGNKVMFRGSGNSVAITNLSAGTVYHFKVFERNGTSTASNYYTVDGASGNPASRTTLAAVPTAQPTSMVFSNVTATSMDVSFTASAGGADGYIAIRRSGASPTGAPTDGTTYVVGNTIGDGTVAFVGSAVTFSDAGLTASTTYHYDIIAFNGSGLSINYVGSLGPLESSRSTLAAEPTTQARDIVFSSVTTTGMTLNWTDGNGAEAIVIVKAGSAVDVNPTDGTGYTGNTNFSSAADIGSGNKVVFRGVGTSVSITNLTANTVYHFKVFELNGSGGLQNYYTADGVSGNPASRTTLATEPSNQPTSIVFSNVGANAMDVSYTAATGTPDGYIAIRRVGASPTGTPTDGTTYVAGNTIGDGTVAFVGSAVTFNDAGLNILTNYFYDIFSFNGSGQAINYRPGGPLSGNQTTSCSAPVTQATSVTFGALNAASIVVNWTRGSGDNVIVLARDGGSTADNPVNGTTYTASATFGSGTPAVAAAGNDYFPVYVGTGTTVTVTGLDASTSYHFKVYEFNNAGPCYNTTSPATGTASTTAASNNSTLTAGTGFASVSSLATTFGTKVAVFQFTITDMGDDGQQLDIGQMIFRPLGGSNEIADWTQLIAGVHLVDNIGTGDLNFTSAIGTNTITISNIDHDVAGGTSNELGEIFNGNAKTYTLSIWLNDPLGGTLPSTVDGQHIAVSLAAADITTDPTGSSGMLAGSSADSYDNGGTNGAITVVATAIRINQQPSTAVNATVPLAQQPIFEAIDANDNRDLGFNFALTVNTTNPDNLAPASAPASFASGIANFTASGFNFATVGTSTMSVTANSITSPNSSSITVSANTAVAQIGNSVTATNGIASSPLSSSATNRALLGFSLTTTGSVLNFTGLTLSTNSDPDGKIKNIELYHSTTNDFTTGTLTLLSTGTTPTAASINFTSFTQSISGAASYYFVVADVEDNVFVTTPQLQLTLTPGTGVVVSTGSVSGGAFSGLNYSFIDTSAPTILSITNSIDPIYEGSLTQTVTVIFSEPMNPLNQPTITLSGTNWGAQNSLGWSTTTLVNDTYTATFLHNGTQQVIAAATSSIASPSGAQDVAGNADTGGGTSASFVLDTQKPIATVTVDTNPIYTGDLVQVVTVQYNEAMNAATSPVITFGSTTHFTPAGPGIWSTTTFTNDTWTRTFNHDGTAETIPADFAVVANTSGAQDVAGNNDVGDTSPTFLIDTKSPTNVDISSPTANGSYTTGQVITIYVYYDETVIVTGTPTLTLSSGGTAFYTSNVIPSVLSFSYTVGPGENATDLDVTAVNLSGGTIKDGSTNDASLALAGTNNDLSFYKNINIDTQTPTVVSVSSTASDGSYGVGNTIFIQVVFSEPVFVTGTPQLALNSGGAALYNSGNGTSTLTFRYDIAVGQNVTDLDYVNTSSLTLPGGALIRDIVLINADLTLATPGAANSISDNQDIIIDSIYPTATSIDISSPTVTWRPELNGTSASSISFLVTFDEDVIGVDVGDFTINIGTSATYSPPLVVTGTNNTRTVTINGVSLLNTSSDGQLKINLVNNGTITDNAGNALSAVPTTTFTGNDFYTILFPEPVDPPINFSVAAQTTTSITVQYGQPTAPVNPIQGYWVQRKKETDPTFLPALVDGVWDGGVTPYFYGSAPTMTTLVPNLISGYKYDFRIVSTSHSGYYSGDLLDYFTGSTLNGTATPPVAAQGTLSFISASSTISSLITASNGTPVFIFNLDEDGASDAADNAPTKFNNLVITPGATNNIANWTTAIAGAQLVDSNGKFVNGTVNAGNITFSSIPASDPDNGGSPDLGFVPDNIVKQFTLRIWLQNPLGAADNSRLDFHVANTSFTYENTTDADETSQISSQLAGSVLESGTVKVDVIATKLVFTTDTPSSPDQIGVKTNFPVPPVVSALDVNDNLDLDYNNTFTVTTSITNFNGHTNFTSGILTLSNFNFTAPGTTTITISGNAGGIYPALTGANQAVSSSVTAVISGLTQITAGATPEPASISSLITTLAGAVQVFDYTITDDAGANVVTFEDNDGLPTLITQMVISQGTGNDADLNTWTDAIQGATLSDGFTTISGTINATNITFSSINTLSPIFFPPAGGLGYIADNGAKTYRLRIYLKNPVTSIADVIDNKDFVFDISEGDISTGVSPTSSTLQASNTNSGNGNNAVSVIATRLDFTTQWTQTPLSAQSYDAPLNPTPIAKARDANGNVDIDYAAAATVLTANPATYPLANATVTNTLSGGTRYFEFDPNLQVTSAGGGLDGQTTNLILSSGSLTNGTSYTFELNYSGNSDIINAAFTYPQNILYSIANNQVSDITAGTGVAMEKFTIRDGGGSADSDGSATKLSSITIEVTNYQYLRRLALYNENTGDEVGDIAVVAGPSVVVVSPGVAQITFSGIALTGAGSFQAADDNSNNLIVKGSFLASGVTDNEVINFSVIDVVAGGVSSAFTLGASTSYPSLAADENQIEVVATQLDFTTPPDPLNISTYTDINNPYIVVSARDANANIDLDYVSAVASITNSGTLAMQNVPTGNFVAGVFDFQVFDIANAPNTFQFTEDSGVGTVTLTLASGSLTDAVSPPFQVAASYESWVTGADRYITYTPPAFIDYAYHQATNIQNDANSFEMIQLVLSDGDAELMQDNIGSSTDIDGANTVLTQFTIGVKNYQAIRRIALYDGGTELIERDASNFTVISADSATMTFSGLNIVAPDNGQKFFSIRASFFNTAAAITDNYPVQLGFVSAVLGGGSKFYDGVDGPTVPSGYIAGNPANDVTAPTTINVLQVTATKFDFTSQPGIFAGIDEPVTTGVVSAHDQFSLLDIDFNSTVNLSTPAAGLNSNSATFTSGLLDLTGLQYTSAGIGTITVDYNSGAIRSNMTGTFNGLPNVSTPCNPINVIHVTARKVKSNVITSNNIKGGSEDNIIFAVNLKAEHTTPAQPKLKELIFSFDLPYKSPSGPILENIKVFISQDSTSKGNNVTVAIPGTTVVETNSSLYPAGTNDLVKVTFPLGSEPLLNNPKLTFYLYVNVDATADINTDNLTPMLLDYGFYDPSTNGNILTTQGSSTANVIGTTYGFANTRPPSLIDTYPRNGQLNVDPAQDTISLVFDVAVLSLDHKALLYDRYSNTLIDTLRAVNSRYFGSSNPLTEVASDTLHFKISNGVTLYPDSVYYVTIAKGEFNAETDKGKGIVDDGKNLFGGISYNGTLYFKIASANAPVMTTTDDTKYYISETGGAINASFDQFGTAYFMVVNEGDATPDNNMIRTGAGYGGTIVALGTIDIKQVHAAQYGSFTANLTPGLTYDVWVYAENDALPSPKATTAPYGSSGNGYAVGAGGPTFQFVASAGFGTVYANTPLFQICANSLTFLADPIILSENNGYPAEFTLTGRQDFNLLLPSGFEFDLTNDPTIELIGDDFDQITDPSNPGDLRVEFLNNTILNISFVNEGSTNLDKIVISGLKVIANNANLFGQIKRFAGNAFPSVVSLGNNEPLAFIESVPSPALEFDNSYNIAGDFENPPIDIDNVVTYIPDNFIDESTQSNIVRLFPDIPKGDYGPSFFDGQGVTNDILSLSGVQLNAAFNIFMTHTDMNGCNSTIIEQYTVYDHTKAIPALGVKDSIRNSNFPLQADSTTATNRVVKYNALAGYKLLALTAAIPTTAKALSDTANIANNQPNEQIIYGPQWESLVRKVPKPFSDGAGTSYHWNYSYILNAKFKTNPPLRDPYNYFRETTPQKKQVYYTGGSLGLVEFTGKYQSDSDPDIKIPVKQLVELFVPPIPLIEISGESDSEGDTLIFCRNGGEFLINGWPAATPGKSKGRFVLRNNTDNTVIYDALHPNPAKQVLVGFTDNTNGTANFNPSAVYNDYKTIKIEYIYKDDNSPAIGKAAFYIRITPNPVANFTVSSYTCKDSPIQFTGTSTISDPARFQITRYRWNINDDQSDVPGNKDTTHVFVQPNNHIVRYRVFSQFNCASNTEIKTIPVGAIPEVRFNFAGVSTSDNIQFLSTSTVNPPNPGIDSLKWNFGDGGSAAGTASTATATSHQYNTAGIYPVRLIIRSNIGCLDTLVKNIVIVPMYAPTDSSPFEENFTSNLGGGWQILKDPNAQPTAPNPSWKWGSPNGDEIKDDVSDTDMAWTTGATITNTTKYYNPKEKSALYSPVFDISALARPMISFNSFTQMGEGDGVVLQYSTDNRNIADPLKQWTTLGSVNQGLASGVDWYNGANLASKPGNQITGDYGWTSQPDPDKDNDFEWMESKHSLGDITGNLTRVAFRFALASIRDNTDRDGFAVDNVRIGNRTRIVLLENFKNLGNGAVIGGTTIEKRESDSLKLFTVATTSSIVKINYHVAFPNMDPFNLDNKQDPGARALYYNVSQTPKVKMDGTSPDNGYFSVWGRQWYNIRSLKLADAMIAPLITYNSDGTISIAVTVRALKDLDSKTILNIAVVEKSVDLANLVTSMQSLVQTQEDQFEYVLKKLLPTAAGTRFNQPLAINQVRTFPAYTWSDGLPLYAPTNDLAVVIFLQDEDSREIFQTDIVDLTNDPSITTGIEDLNTSFNVYPIPADKAMLIELPQPAIDGTVLKMYDQVGREVEVSRFEKGDSQKTINTAEFAGGVYLIQINSPKGILRRKVTVVHRN